MHARAFQMRAPSPRLAASAAAAGLLIAAAALVALAPSLFGDRPASSGFPLAALEIAPLGLDGRADAGAWTTYRGGALALPDGAGVIRAAFDIPVRAPGEAPLALYLSGEFSATAIWNGVEIGSKGRPGATPGEEIAGPVAAVVHIPADLLRPGRNELVLHASSHHAVFNPGAMFHATSQRFGLAVDVYDGRARRSIGYYAAPLLMLAAYGAGFAVIAAGAFTRRPRLETAFALAAMAGLALVAGAEIARAVVNYPYPWHGLRMGAQLAGALLAGAALAGYAVRRAGVRRWRWAVAAIAVIVPAAAFTATGFDERNMSALVAGCALAGLLAAKMALEKREGGLALAAALALMVLAAFAGTKDFLDRLAYAASLPLVFVIARRERGAPATAGVIGAAAAPPADRLIVKSAGRERVIAVDDIRAVHAAGNYVELELADGLRLADDRTLASLAAALPPTFVRVHRSHIVNLAMITAIRTRGGGRYEAELAGGGCAPVARSRVAGLRARLNGLAGQGGLEEG